MHISDKFHNSDQILNVSAVVRGSFCLTRHKVSYSTCHYGYEQIAFCVMQPQGSSPKHYTCMCIWIVCTHTMQHYVRFIFLSRKQTGQTPGHTLGPIILILRVFIYMIEEKRFTVYTIFQRAYHSCIYIFVKLKPYKECIMY